MEVQVRKMEIFQYNSMLLQLYAQLSSRSQKINTSTELLNISCFIPVCMYFCYWFLFIMLMQHFFFLISLAVDGMDG